MIDQIPEIKEAFDSFTKQVFEKEVLSEREKAIVALVMVITQEDAEGIKKAVMTCKQMMLSSEEIAHIVSIVIAMKAQKTTHLFNKTQEKTNTTQRCC